MTQNPFHRLAGRLKNLYPPRAFPLLLFLLLLATPAAADVKTTGFYLVVWLKDGSTAEAHLSEKPVIIYSDGNFLVRTASKTLEYAAAGVRKFTLSETSYSRIPGDVNGDGTLNTADAIAIVNHVIGKAQDNFDQTVADVNSDGVINTADAIAVVNSIIGKKAGQHKSSKQQ